MSVLECAWMNETKCLCLRNCLASFTVIMKKQKEGIQSSATALYKVRMGTCFMLLTSRQGRGDAEIKSNHCLYYIFSSSIFTQEKMVFNANLIYIIYSVSYSLTKSKLLLLKLSEIELKVYIFMLFED